MSLYVVFPKGPSVQMISNNKFCGKISLHLEKTRFFCDDIFFRSLKKPFVLLIIAFVFFSAFHILDSHFDLSFACSAVLKVRDFSILVAFVWLCISFASLFEKKFVKKRKKKKNL